MPAATRAPNTQSSAPKTDETVLKVRKGSGHELMSSNFYAAAVYITAQRLYFKWRNNMMKLTLTAATFSFAMALSAVAYAGSGHNHDDASHGKSMEMHNEHASAIGKPSDAAKVTRTIAVDMTDNMRYPCKNRGQERRDD